MHVHSDTALLPGCTAALTVSLAGAWSWYAAGRPSQGQIAPLQRAVVLAAQPGGEHEDNTDAASSTEGGCCLQHRCLCCTTRTTMHNTACTCMQVWSEIALAFKDECSAMNETYLASAHTDVVRHGVPFPGTAFTSGWIGEGHTLAHRDKPAA